MRQMFIGVATAFFGFLLVILLFILVSGEPSNQELHDRQSEINAQLSYISCLLLVAPEDRIPSVVATCLDAAVSPSTP